MMKSGDQDDDPAKMTTGFPDDAWVEFKIRNCGYRQHQTFISRAHLAQGVRGSKDECALTIILAITAIVSST